MKCAAVFVVVACFLIIHVQGQARPSVRRCLCSVQLMNNVHPKRIERFEIYPASASCENVEMIVVLKNGAGKRCLNPESKFAKNYVWKAIQKRSQPQEKRDH